MLSHIHINNNDFRIRFFPVEHSENESENENEREREIENGKSSLRNILTREIEINEREYT